MSPIQSTLYFEPDFNGGEAKKNKNSRLKKLTFSKPPIFNIFLPKFQVLAWLYRINWCEGHEYGSTHMVVRLSERRPFYTQKCMKISGFFELVILIFFSSFPSKSGTNYGIEWMGPNFYDYHNFQPKTTHPKHFWGNVPLVDISDGFL